MLDVFARHEKVAFQFSGGKDSLAALWLLKPYWSRMTVYWLNTGDPVPELQEFVDKVAEEVPHFKVIQGQQLATIERFGWPADVLPADASLFGRVATASSGSVFQTREHCCVNSLMKPMHDQMLRDGVTLIIRGQKACDPRKAPIESGYVEDGIEYYFPIESWSNDDVRRFLTQQSVALPSFYGTLSASPDCLTCTAYLDENRKQFLQTNHPEAWKTVHFRLTELKYALRDPLTHLMQHLED